MNVPADALKEFPVSLVERESGRPASFAHLILETEPEPTVLKSNKHGQVVVPVSSTLLRMNPLIRAESDNEEMIDTVVSLTATIHGKIERVELSSAPELQKVGTEQVAVFFRPEDSGLANQVRAELIRARRELKTMLGMEPQRWAVIVGPKREQDVLYMTVPATGYDSTWICFREEWVTGEFLRTNIHEWAESTIESNLSLYSDPRNRYIGDGLAELAAWKIAGLPDDYQQRLSPQAVGNRETIDLLSEFQAVPGSAFHLRRFDRGIAKHGFSPGYALSFAFWHRLRSEEGRSFPSKFLRAWKTNRPATAEAGIALLEQISGNDELSARIHKASVSEARERIARL